jgi:DNA-directed RNA polymerase subunit RPC12/RpoP
VAAFTRELRCAECGREYLVSGESPVPTSETEALAQVRCSCGTWMGAFVPGSADVERLIVTVRGGDSRPTESPFHASIQGDGRKKAKRPR